MATKLRNGWRMKTRIQKSLLLLILAAMGLGLTACNTTRGVGEDIEEAGEGIQKAANK